MASGPRFLRGSRGQFFLVRPSLSSTIACMDSLVFGSLTNLFPAPERVAFFSWPFRSMTSWSPGTNIPSLGGPSKQASWSGGLVCRLFDRKSCLGPVCRWAWRSKEPSLAPDRQSARGRSGRASLAQSYGGRINSNLAPNRHAR